MSAGAGQPPPPATTSPNSLPENSALRDLIPACRDRGGNTVPSLENPQSNLTPKSSPLWKPRLILVVLKHAHPHLCGSSLTSAFLKDEVTEGICCSNDCQVCGARRAKVVPDL